MEEIIRGRKTIRTIRYCIYCGVSGTREKLSKEHIIPFSLGADAVLKEASCSDCARITRGFEHHVARNIYGDHRIHRGVQTRHPEQRPTTLPLRVIRGGIETSYDLPISNHLYFQSVPVWAAPGYMRDALPQIEFEGLNAHLYWHVPDNIRETLGIGPRDIVEVRPNAVNVDANQFGRALAKFAYCHAIGALGYGSFAPLDLQELILGRYPYISYYVGSDLSLPPPPVRDGPEHEITLLEVPIRGERVLWSKIRLFAKDGTRDRGMPIYAVIIGKRAATQAQP